MVVCQPGRGLEMASQGPGPFRKGFLVRRLLRTDSDCQKGSEDNYMAGGKEQGFQSQAALGSNPASTH